MKIARTLARRLLEINAIKLRPNDPFTWASGIKSPIYCDNRMTLAHPELRDLIKSSFAELSKEFGDAQLVAGVATAGIPHGALLADYLKLPMIYVRSKPKAHGRQNLIEGSFEKGAKTIVVEDLISTGGSSLQAVEAMRSEELKVLGVVSIFDYQLEKAIHNFKSHECPFQSLSNYTTLLEVASEINYISPEEKEVLTSWNKDPENWYSNNF